MSLGCWVTEKGRMHQMFLIFGIHQFCLIFGILSYIVGYNKQAKKIGKNKKICRSKKILPPMRGSHPGTLLSSGRWEVQFQDVVIEIVHTNTFVRHRNRELEGTVHQSNSILPEERRVH